MITGFNHSGFVVKDIDMMVEFYRDTLGLEVMREVDSVAPPEGDHTGIPGARRTLVFVGKPDGEHVLELVHFIDPPSPEGHLDRHQLGAAHICFKRHRPSGVGGASAIPRHQVRDRPDIPHDSGRTKTGHLLHPRPGGELRGAHSTTGVRVPLGTCHALEVVFHGERMGLLLTGSRLLILETI